MKELEAPSHAPEIGGKDLEDDRTILIGGLCFLNNLLVVINLFMLNQVVLVYLILTTGFTFDR